MKFVYVVAVYTACVLMLPSCWLCVYVYVCLTWQGTIYKLPVDDTSVETCRSVINPGLIVHLFIIVQNSKRCTVHVLKLGSAVFHDHSWICAL
jgi:hypothetical protein